MLVCFDRFETCRCWFLECTPLDAFCVCAPCSHRDPFELVFSGGAQEAHRAVPNEALYGDFRTCSLISCTYLPFEPLNKLLLQASLRLRSTDVSGRRHFDLFVGAFGPIPFEDLQVRFGRQQVDHSGQSILRFVGTCRKLRYTQSVCTSTMRRSPRCFS